jgi:hypothetical protein
MGGLVVGRGEDKKMYTYQFSGNSMLLASCTTGGIIAKRT